MSYPTLRNSEPDPGWSPEKVRRFVLYGLLLFWFIVYPPLVLVLVVVSLIVIPVSCVAYRYQLDHNKAFSRRFKPTHA